MPPPPPSGVVLPHQREYTTDGVFPHHRPSEDHFVCRRCTSPCPCHRWSTSSCCQSTGCLEYRLMYSATLSTMAAAMSALPLKYFVLTTVSPWSSHWWLQKAGVRLPSFTQRPPCHRRWHADAHNVVDGVGVGVVGVGVGVVIVGGGDALDAEVASRLGWMVCGSETNMAS